ncbi:MAG: hypothetical protein ACI8R9_000637 [Paraglaciecola sp.]|jgi:hypothetical protein
MKKNIALISLLLIPQASSNPLEHGVGIGLQYGGILGYQLAYHEAQHNFRAAAGLIGGSFGYDYYLTDNFSLGATYTLSVRNASSLNINYIPSKDKNSRWIFGIDLAHINSQRSSGSGFFLKQEKESKNVMWLSAGYKF